MKVYPFTIPKKPDENIIVQVDKGQHFYDRLHQHDEIQLSFIKSGQGKLIVGNKVTTFRMYDFVGLGANLPHLFQSTIGETNAHMISLFFSKDCFGEDFFSSNEMNILRPSFDMLQMGVKLNHNKEIENIFETITQKNEFEVFLALLKVLKILSFSENEVLNEPGLVHKLTSSQGQRLQEVIDFTLRNFQHPLTLEEVAEKAHMSRNSFCRFFKQRTNKTYFQFLTEVRIHHSCQMLVQQLDLAIAEIAMLCGYQTISNFNRHFKEIVGVNPKSFRKSSDTKI